MKKFVVFPVLLALMLAPVFGQEDEREPGWTFSGEAAVVADLIFFTKASGKIGDDGSKNAGEKWGKNIGGSFNVLNSSGNSSILGIGSSMFIKGYDQGDNYGYDMQLQLNVGIFGRADGIHLNEDVTFLNLLAFGFGDWFLTGNAGIFEGYIGNTGYGGVVPAYGNFTDWSNFKLEGFYVKKGSSDDKQDTDKMNLWSGGSSFALGVNFLDDKLRFALGTDFGYGGNASANYTFVSPYASANSFNFAAIFSGKGLADLLSFDVFYGINGRDSNTSMFSNKATYSNAFGAYVGLDIGDNFGLSVGYSAAVDIMEKQYGGTKGDEPYSISNPLWSAVHVHLNFTGLDRFDFTFNNNISFAGRKGKDWTKPSDGKQILGFDGDELSDGFKQNYFGWDTGLAVKFQATEELGLCLQLTNQLDINSATPKTGDKVSGTSNTFFAGFNAEYTVKMVTFGAGLNFQMASGSGKIGDKKDDSEKAVALGIPLFFKVVF